MAYKNILENFPGYQVQAEISEFSNMEARAWDFHGVFDSYQLKLKNGLHAKIIVDHSSKEIILGEDELERILDMFPAPE